MPEPAGHRAAPSPSGIPGLAANAATGSGMEEHPQ